MTFTPSTCWACGATGLTLYKKGNAQQVESTHFAITDPHYGITGTLSRCPRCHFLQCDDFASLTHFYETLIDPEYEVTRAPRALQARRLLDTLPVTCPTPSLLDIGAGSGILVEAAQDRDWHAQGIEPSQWLSEQAILRGLAVHEGTLPHPDVTQTFDLVTLVDVLEHVNDPLTLLKNARAHLSPNGVGLLVTPDRGSLTARLMGFRWWHYRVAHVGYFNRTALTLLLQRAGLEPITWRRPTWYFPLDYLWVRLGCYVPYWPAPPSWTKSVTLPLNLFDSFSITFRVAAP